MAIYNSANNSWQGFNKTLFEGVILTDSFGNPVPGANPTGVAVDAFGRARMSQPYTLFDSFHRFQDNGKESTANSATGAIVSHNANAGLIECTLDTTSGSFIKRESSRVFAYQPGKSLQILQTFVMSAPKANLRQRYGYFNEDNGIFIEQVGSEIYFVERSNSTNTLAETRVPKSQWNIDKLDGTGPSNKVLDLTKAQIMFTDIEWLGLGTVRMGFVIDGQLIHCHSFHHANIIQTTYMTTACLPVRTEIENLGTTVSSSTLKVVCTSVISEGGYEIRGKQRCVSMPVTSPRTFTTSGTFYPVISIRLKDLRSDGIVVPTAAEFFGVTNNTSYRWKIIISGVLTSPSWVSIGNDSCVEYDISATGITGGTEVAVGYLNVSSGAGAALSELSNSEFFKFQLERNSFATSDKGYVFSLVATGASNGNQGVGALSWQEIT